MDLAAMAGGLKQGTKASVLGGRTNIELPNACVQLSQWWRSSTGLRSVPGPPGEPTPLSSHQVAWVPGSFELPVVAKAMAKSGKYDAVIAIGVVVRPRGVHG